MNSISDSRLSKLAGILCVCVSTLVLGLSACNAMNDFDDSKPLPVKQASAIPPGLFTFVQVTDPDKDGGGWWTTCLHVHLKRDKDDTEEDRPRRFTCEIELGIPIFTVERGHISQRRAQEIAAEVTSRAVDDVPRRGRITSMICKELVKETLRLGDLERPGTKVSKCGSTLSKQTIPDVEWSQ